MRLQGFAIATVLFSSCALHPGTAKADTFDFTITATQPSNRGVYLTSSGTLTTAPDATVAGAQDILSATGTVNGVAITGTVPSDFSVATVTFPDTFYFTYDNLLYPSAASIFDVKGLAFQDATGVDYNFANVPGTGLAYEAFNGDLPFDQATLFAPAINITLTDTTAVTPEPSSMLLLGTGLLGMAGMLRRRRA